MYKLRKKVINEYDRGNIVKEIYTSSVFRLDGDIIIKLKNGDEIYAKYNGKLSEISILIEKYVMKQRILKINKIQQKLVNPK